MTSVPESHRIPVSAGLIPALALLIGTAAANERHFTYNYETSVLAPGARELEVSNTLRVGKSDYYSRLDHRLEFEVGVAENLMTAFYLNVTNTTEETAPGTLTSAVSWKGFSNEWKWKLMDPVADPVGLALYGEVTYNTDGFELEPKVLFDKRLGQCLLAANLVTEFEFAAEADESELEEISPELDLGLTYELAKGFHAGLEFRNSNVIEKNDDGDLEFLNSALFLGPVVSYAAESWWVTLTVLPQLPAIKTEEGTKPILDLEDHEKVNARLLFSFHI